MLQNVFSGYRRRLRTCYDARVTDTSTRLAYQRTRAAYERTLQAWIRTATSLITFGFSVYKFFQFEAPRRDDAHALLGPRRFGEILVALGMSALILATFEYYGRIHELQREYPVAQPRSLAVAVASVLSLLGLFALIVMLLRL